MNVPITSFAKEHQCAPPSACNNEQGLKYGVVSNLATIYEFLCENIFKFLTFNFDYCLFSMLFMILLKKLTNMIKNCFSREEDYQKNLNL